MADILVTSPFQPFTLPTQFKAVFNGYIYCGTVDAVDPSVSQVQVYLVNESGDKVPVAQPLRTNAGGFLVYNGQPAKFITDANFSLLIRDSIGSDVWYFPNVATIDPDAALKILGITGDPGNGGFFAGEQNPTIFRMRDRIFMGEGAKHTGRRTGALGGSWLTEFGANYFEKNAQNSLLGIQGRYGALVGGWSNDGVAPPGGGSNTSSIGLAAVGVNRSSGATARAIYAEGMHFGGSGGAAAGSTSAIEVQVGNFSAVDNTTAGPYDLGPGVSGIGIGVESGVGYRVGDSDTPITPATFPARNGLTFNGGSIDAAYQKWRKGIIFVHNSLYRGTDGFNGNATAVMMAKGHQVEWWSSTGIKNATIRSDGTASANRDTSLLFKDNRVELCTTGELPALAVRPDPLGTPVANAIITSGRNNSFVVLGLESASSTNVPFGIHSKGTGVISLRSHDGTSEHLRIDSSTAGATDYVTLKGGAGDGIANINTGGASADVHLRLTPKGAGNVQFGKTQTPTTDNALDYGSASLRGRTAYFGTGTINTSDANEKTKPLSLEVLSELQGASRDSILDAWGDVQLIAFQWLDAIQQKGVDVARWHFGVIAQQVRDAFAARGLDGTRYGLLCYDEWDDIYTKVQTNEGEMVTKTRMVSKPVMITTSKVVVPAIEHEDGTVSPAVREEYQAIKMVQVYQFNEDGSPRFNEDGTRATDFVAVMEDVEEEYLDYAEPEYVEVLEIAAGNRWGIRPDQCLFLEAAYQRRRCERIEARLLAAGL